MKGIPPEGSKVKGRTIWGFAPRCFLTSRHLAATLSGLEIDGRPVERRPAVAHGDPKPPERCGFAAPALVERAEEIRHTRGSWASGW